VIVRVLTAAVTVTNTIEDGQITPMPAQERNTNFY